MSLTKRIPEVLGLVVALVLAGGCETLNVKNPNAPDTNRALGDPATVQAIAAGALRSWYNVTLNMDPDGILITQADSHTASWNNFQIRFYSGCTSGPAPTFGTCGALETDATKITSGTYPRTSWQNDLAAAERLQIERYWYGYYSALSSATDVVKAIRQNALVITDASNTKMVETIAVLVQGLALSGLALNYDKAFIVDETTPLDANGSPIVSFSPRAAVRDAALAKFNDAIVLSSDPAWATSLKVPVSFFNDPGVSYDKVQIRKIANTMAARTLAYYPRNLAENLAVNWTTVLGYASAGISSGTAFDWIFKHDGCINYCDYLKLWSNDMGTMRIHTRVAQKLDPASQEHPFPNNNPATILSVPLTANAAPQAATPAAMTYITTGRQLTIGGGVAAERVIVTATAPTTFTAVFTKNHPSTTLTAAITGSKTAQAATPVSMTDIIVGTALTIDAGTKTETVKVTAVTATTFTAVFNLDHAAGVPVAAPVHRNGGAPGNDQPNSPDKRLGDGTYGSGTFASDVTETLDATANAGTDYAWSFDEAVFPAARGSWHQSSIGQIRYITLSDIDPNGTANGFGPSPIVLAAENDLIWAEALIRGTPQNLAGAAALIDKTRVGRGGLGSAAGFSAAAMLDALYYEQDVELPGSNVAPFYNQRRIDGLEGLTAHEQPVPAKELGVLQLPFYTFGGTQPPNSSPMAPVPALSAQNVQLMWANLEHQTFMNVRSRSSRR